MAFHWVNEKGDFKKVLGVGGNKRRCKGAKVQKWKGEEMVTGFGCRVTGVGERERQEAVER